MKLSFQQRLVASFVVVFVLFTVGVLTFEQRRIKRYKTEALEERLDAYAGQIARYIEESRDTTDHYYLRQIVSRMPPELRATVIYRDGTVIWDTELLDGVMDNHAGRPEIAAALAVGHGTSIRRSESLRREYLYYARSAREGDWVVRVALPYDIEVRSLLKPDNTFLYFVVGLFLAGLVFILYLGNYFGTSVKRLREHEAREKTRNLKREMTGNIAHELRTPVTSIRGFLEIVLGNELDDARRRQYLERAYSQTRTLSALISDMSLLARIDEKQGAFEFTEIDAAELLEKVRSDTLKGLIEKNIAFRVEIPTGLTFRGNESLLYSVFRNLTDNVISHAGDGAVIRVAARIVEGEGNGGKAGKGPMARVSFSDTGRGVPTKEHLERIFERFYRVSEGRTRDTGGSGLGLSIVKNTVALHGGTISAHSNTPSGLEFVFYLPAK